MKETTVRPEVRSDGEPAAPAVVPAATGDERASCSDAQATPLPEIDEDDLSNPIALAIRMSRFMERRCSTGLKCPLVEIHPLNHDV